MDKKIKLKRYSSFTDKEKAEMYCAAQNHCPDEKIMIDFRCDENTMLRCIEDVFVSLQTERGFSGIWRHK